MRKNELIIVQFLFLFPTTYILSSSSFAPGEPVAGIDLGTSTTCIGVYVDGQVEIIPNEMGDLQTPSCVSFAEGEPLVGDEAVSYLTIEPSKTLYGKSV